MQRQEHSRHLAEGTGARASPARLAVLGLLTERPAHPYEVALRFTERVGPAWGIHRGQVYQAVYGLEQEGLLERVEATNGDESRTVFRATSDGHDAFETWIASDAAGDLGPIRNTLFIRLAFLRPDHVPSLLELVARREHAVLWRIREYSDSCPEVEMPQTPADWPELGLHLILEGTVATLQSELRWLREVRDVLETLSVESGVTAP
jgi:DNA-binding PadR family transcriptional regulator